ncbi:MAG: hypothetical protein HY271_04430 [Deltaproteobacteria bacterium]|nr:hypothetical protein [Deltaproteobacteria bacterium]
MARALEKLASRERSWGDGSGREIVCHRCGTQCVLPAGARLEETACVGCVQRLGEAGRRGDGWPAVAMCAVAEWSNKAVVGGRGYGLVSCPHYDAECVVEVGEAARTGCIACLRPLGAQPLVRQDLAARRLVLSTLSACAEDESLDRSLLGRPIADDVSCMLFPGEPS